MEEMIFDAQNMGICYQKAASLPWRNGKFWALHDVSFRVYRGQTVGVIGRNGAGKSTLLKVLAGIIHPDRGTLRRANVAVTMQSLGAGFDPRLTGRQNIYLSGLLLGMGRSLITSRMEEIIELADIGHFIDEPIKHYSSGMRARLGFSIAYHVNAEVILIDEVLAVGDQAFKKQASRLIGEKINSNHTVVLVTHVMGMVKELCQRVIHIERGRSLPELSVEESIERYMSEVQ